MNEVPGGLSGSRLGRLRHLGGEDDQRQPKDIPRHRQREGREDDHRRFPPHAKGDEPVNGKERQRHRQAANAATRGGDLVGVAALGVKNLHAFLNDVDAEQRAANPPRDVRHQVSQRHGDEVGHRPERHGKRKQEDGKETGPQPGRPPNQTGQRVHTKIKSDNRDACLLDDVAEQMHRQRTCHQRHRRPPVALGRGEQFVAFPVAQAQHDQRDDVAQLVVLRASVGVVHPAVKRRRIDVAEGGVAEQLEENQPSPKQREEQRLVRHPPPKARQLVPDRGAAGFGIGFRFAHDTRSVA